ncbi:hypothetical protein BN137_2980 [Cronobacter condimenti 1330]|uniref:Uncharacterized protein n=1 Tax=Cronobacter condimenti 1330 TaxID=1073999 RepID=K8A223_9ENTR|nr:hypothetical protein BN137_2980 [Cronobacter condimenti 1330]
MCGVFFYALNQRIIIDKIFALRINGLFCAPSVFSRHLSISIFNCLK